ncbi:exodeoxyribonuclease V subunit alpha [Methyloglobulus sp.]|uniref:exodeoxyribonuclease V subunit alpha n=1 Tax=Methyloglobulus sp. TaxID=2518622 RepID=UPI0032B748FF
MLMPNEEEIFSRLDLAFASFLSQRTTLDAARLKALETLLATLSQQQHQGHSCIEISDADKTLLLDSGLICEDPTSSYQTVPLVVEKNRLYLQRYWHYEDRLARQIKTLSRIGKSVVNLDYLLDRYFPATNTETNYQRVAAKLAAQQSFCIITGGPGTGKTTTICKILAVLQELADEPLLIALAAPTGKAAMRLQEAISQNLAELNCPDTIKNHIPHTANTLHRLLGAQPPSPYFRHDKDNPLVFDLVVVDEASMVDLALMSKLVDALKPGAKLILLGDKDQLASVESGAVLADLIAALPNNTVELKHSYRFEMGIKQLADAVNQQDFETAWDILSTNHDATKLLEQEQLMPYILDKRKEYLRLVNTKAKFSMLYQAFNSFQVLCSNRHGKNGALEINTAVEQDLFGLRLKYGTTFWYPGRPVMILQNNPTLHLYNGDIGICLPDHEQNDNLMVFFQRADGAVKKHLPARMPTCETVFAMTVHKSQGSEFEEVLIVLPETVNPVLSKELLYTAITRARKKINIVAEESVFTATINRKMERITGLVNKFQQSSFNYRRKETERLPTEKQNGLR